MKLNTLPLSVNNSLLTSWDVCNKLMKSKNSYFVSAYLCKIAEQIPSKSSFRGSFKVTTKLGNLKEIFFLLFPHFYQTIMYFQKIWWYCLYLPELTTSLGNLFQHIITLSQKNFLLPSNLNLPLLEFKTVPPCPIIIYPRKLSVYPCICPCIYQLTIQLPTDWCPSSNIKFHLPPTDNSQPMGKGQPPGNFKQLYSLLRNVMWYGIIPGLTMALCPLVIWLCPTNCFCAIKAVALPHWVTCPSPVPSHVPVIITQQQWKHWPTINIVPVEIWIKTLHVWFL